MLHPSVVSPEIPGAAFLGWTADRSVTTALSSLVMGSEPITLYAVYKYDDTVENTTFTGWGADVGVGTHEKDIAVYGGNAIDTDKYSEALIYSRNVDIRPDWSGFSCYLSYKLGNNTVNFATATVGLGEPYPITKNPSAGDRCGDITTKMQISPNQGVIPIKLVLKITAGREGGGRAKAYINNAADGKITLTGRTVVG